MNMIKKLLLSTCCIGLTICDFALACDKIGLDLFKSNFSLKERYGKEIYGKNLGGINIFGQYYFKNNAFIEYGYEYMRSKNENIINPGEYSPGAPGPQPLWAKYNTKIKQQFPYVGVGYDIGIGEKSSVSLLGGVAVIRVTGFHEWIGHAVFPVTPSATAISRRNFDKIKPSFLFKLSVNHEFNNYLGVRFTSAWRKLDHFKIKSADSVSEIRLKNCASVGVGIFYSL